MWVSKRRTVTIGAPPPGTEHEVRDMLGDGVVRAAATALHLLEHKYRRITGGGGPEVVSSLPAGPMQLAGDRLRVPD